MPVPSPACHWNNLAGILSIISSVHWMVQVTPKCRIDSHYKEDRTAVNEIYQFTPIPSPPQIPSNQVPGSDCQVRFLYLRLILTELRRPGRFKQVLLLHLISWNTLLLMPLLPVCQLALLGAVPRPLAACAHRQLHRGTCIGFGKYIWGFSRAFGWRSMNECTPSLSWTPQHLTAGLA